MLRKRKNHVFLSLSEARKNQIFLSLRAKRSNRNPLFLANSVSLVKRIFVIDLVGANDKKNQILGLTHTPRQGIFI